MNKAALRQLKFFYADLFDVVCFSHTLDNTGSHFESQTLRPTAASLEELRNFPFVNNDVAIANLAQELPPYIAAADGVNDTCEKDKVTW